jgi:ribosomal protein L32
MARVTCRCGETLQVKTGDPDRLICPRCGAKIRVHRASSARQASGDPDDGYIRFNCPCGRRLKVQASGRPDAGKCPDCGRIVPVPDSDWDKDDPASREAGDPIRSGRGRPNARTEDLDAADLEYLEKWASRHLAASNPAERPEEPSTGSHHSLQATLVEEPVRGIPSSVVKMEAGLRVCPRCGKPLHMSATVCRDCGEPAPRR